MSSQAINHQPDLSGSVSTSQMSEEEGSSSLSLSYATRHQLSQEVMAPESGRELKYCRRIIYSIAIIQESKNVSLSNTTIHKHPVISWNLRILKRLKLLFGTGIF